MELNPGATKKSQKSPTKSSSKPVLDGTEQPEVTEPSESFQKVLAAIRNSEGYPALHDQMMKEFIQKPPELVNDIYTIPVINENALKGKTSAFSQTFTQMEHSTNGQYAVGVTTDSSVYLFNICSKYEGESRFVKLPTNKIKKTHHKENNASDDSIPSEDPITRYDPQQYLTGKKKEENINATEHEKGSSKKPKQFMISFSTDSTLLAVVERGKECLNIFNCKEAMKMNNFESSPKAYYQMDFLEDDEEIEVAGIYKLEFMYFYHPSFDYQRYPSVDVDCLVLGFSKMLIVLNLQKDDLNMNTEDFSITTWMEAMRGGIESSCIEGNELYIQSIKEFKDVELYTNKGNYIYIVKAKGNQKYIYGYRLDWDNLSRKRRFQLRFEYKLNENVDPFFKTFSPDGASMFAYNKKLSQIQRLRLDTINQYEEVYTLTGAKKNLLHLAVKDDGKYLLLVDSNHKGEILIKSNATYASLMTFNAKLALEATSFTKIKGYVKNGLEKDEIEHDVTNMDFLEDGSGIVGCNVNSAIVWRLTLPHTRFNTSIYLKDHYFTANLKEKVDGTYSVNFIVAGNSPIQKIIDFNPATNRGCIVRSFALSDYGDLDEVYNTDFMYNGKVKSKNIMQQGFGSYTDQFKQLKDFLQEERPVHIVTVPGKDLIILLSSGYMSVRAVSKLHSHRMPKSDVYEDDNYEEDDDEDEDEEKKKLWNKDISSDLSEGIENGDEIAYSGPIDVWRKHSPVIVDSQGQYFILMWESGAASIVSVDSGEMLAAVNGGHMVYPLDSEHVLVVNYDEETYAAYKEEEEPTPGKGTMTLRVFNFVQKSFTATKQELTATYLEYVDIVKPAKDSAGEPEPVNYCLLIGDNKLHMFDYMNNRIANTITLCEIEEKIPVGSQYQTQCVLMSPNKKFLAVSSLVDCENITIVHITNGCLNPTEIVMKVKNDRINRWCFSHDSKYFLLKSAESINTYDLQQSCAMIGVIPIDDPIIRMGKVLAINLCNNSEDLEIVFGYKNYIYFNRVPFYSKHQDLMLPMIHNKLKEYMSDVRSSRAEQRAVNIALIMAHLPPYQRRIDDTYVKILAMCDNTKVLSKYFEYQKDDSDIIFKYKSFASIILMNSKCENNKPMLKMHNNTANSFIDLIEDSLNRYKKFPDVDRNILENWLKSEKLEITYKRKLLKLITFEPISTELKGELRDEDKLAYSLQQYTDEGQLRPANLWINEAIEALVDIESTSQVELKCYKSSISFDLSNGSEFSLDYFRWMSEASDDDITKYYKSVIYYKWQKVFPAACVYSCIIWILNALYVAFMGFAYNNTGLMVTILILNCLLILYEIKCFSFTFKDSYRDLWNYYDLFINSFSIFSVLFVYTTHGDKEAYKYSWLRLFSFVLISLRAFMMLRVFKPTRYLVVMLLEVFMDIRAFLSIFGYCIFMYWFVCLVRPGLVIDGESDTTFFSAVQQAMNIAFGNFDADVDSVMVFVTTIIGQIVLSLVLLNYLIAIVNSTYARISDSRDLHNLKILIDIIREFDCFFNMKKKFSIKNTEQIFFIIPMEEASNTLEDLRLNFDKLRSEIRAGIDKALDDQKTQVEAALEATFKKWVAPLSKQVGTLGQNLEELEEEVNRNKQKWEEERKKEREDEGMLKREAGKLAREEKDAYRDRVKKEIEAESKATLEKEREELKMLMLKEGRKDDEVAEALAEMEKEAHNVMLMDIKERENEEFGKQQSVISDTSILDASDMESESEEEFDEESNSKDYEANSMVDQVEEEEEYDAEGECNVEF